jgi:hypothetical protein
MGSNPVTEFIKGLFRARIEGARAGGMAKVFGAQARIKGKVASKFNQAVDAPLNKAKGALKKDKKDKDEQKKEKGMGFFSKKKPAPQPVPQGDSDEPMKTVAISLDQIGTREVVGWVVVMGGEQQGKDFRLCSGKNLVGTGADCDVVLTDPYLSARHCVIRYEEGQYRIKDLDSTNGVIVNGKKTGDVELIDNDMIKLGKTELKFKALF